MKKQLLSFLFCLLLVSAYSQFEVHPQELIIQSHKQYLSERTDYHGDASDFFKSNSSENCTQDSSHIYTQKQLGSRTYYTYDAEGNQTETYTEYLDQNVWTPNYQSFMTYNDDNILLQVNDQFWNGSEWTALSNVIYTYTSAGNLETLLGQNWSNGNWEDSYQVIYTYNDQDLVTTGTLQFWEDGQWLDTSFVTYTHNEEGLLWQVMSQQLVDGEWINESTIVYEYNAQEQLIEELYNYWSGTEWLPMSLTTSTYDSEGNLIQQISSNWDEDLWQQIFREDFEYDEYHNLTSTMSYSWLNDSWVGPNVVFENFYTCASVGVETPNDVISLELYPNPTSGIVTIQLDQASVVRVFDMNGKVIQQERVAPQSSTSLHLPVAKGIYLIQAIDDFGNTMNARVMKN